MSTHIGIVLTSLPLSRITVMRHHERLIMFTKCLQIFADLKIRLTSLEIRKTGGVSQTLDCQLF